MPQLDFTMFPTQIFWLVITFLPLFFLIWKISEPRISETLEARQKRIEDNLERASKFKKEAESTLLAYETSLSDARAASALTIAEANKKLEEEIALRQLETSLRLNKMIDDSEVKIQNAVNEALDNIHKTVEDVATNTTELLLGTSVDHETIKSSVDDALDNNLSIGKLTITREQV